MSANALALAVAAVARIEHAVRLPFIAELDVELRHDREMRPALATYLRVTPTIRPLYANGLDPLNEPATAGKDT